MESNSFPVAKIFDLVGCNDNTEWRNKMRKYEIEAIQDLCDAIAEGDPIDISYKRERVVNLLPRIGESAVKFVCPECQATRLECVEEGVYDSEVLCIDEDGDFDFGDINGHGSVERFQCLGCGYTLTEDPDYPMAYNLTEHSEVVEWCKQMCKQE